MGSRAAAPVTERTGERVGTTDPDHGKLRFLLESFWTFPKGKLPSWLVFPKGLCSLRMGKRRDENGLKRRVGRARGRKQMMESWKRVVFGVLDHRNRASGIQTAERHAGSAHPAWTSVWGSLSWERPCAQDRSGLKMSFFRDWRAWVRICWA